MSNRNIIYLSAKFFLPQLTWFVKTNEKVIFLSFDDGPSPIVTPWVLDTLLKYDAKATFFCLGKKCEKHPNILSAILSKGHSIGIHGYEHLDAWKTNKKIIIKDFNKAKKIINADLYRPPYGHYRFFMNQFVEQNHQIIMWDIMAYDFKKNISVEQCVQNVNGKLKNGSIVVFHDNIKSFNTLKYALPIVLRRIQEKGFKCKSL